MFLSTQFFFSFELIIWKENKFSPITLISTPFLTLHICLIVDCREPALKDESVQSLLIRHKLRRLISYAFNSCSATTTTSSSPLPRGFSVPSILLLGHQPRGKTPHTRKVRSKNTRTESRSDDDPWAKR